MGLRTSWEASRLQSYEILQLFPSDDEYPDAKFVNGFMLPKALELTKK